MDRPPGVFGDQLPHRVVCEHGGAVRDARRFAGLWLQVLARDGDLLVRRVAGQPDDLPGDARESVTRESRQISSG